MLIMWFWFRLYTVSGFLYPSQIHLSWTENPNEMRVTWSSSMSSSASISYKPVLCKKNSDWLYSSAESSRVNFGTDKYRYEYIHTGVMSNLSPDCFYEYSVSTGHLWSDKYLFNGRTPGVQDYSPHKMIIFGDLGTYQHALYTVKMLQEVMKADEILGFMHLGDIAYELQHNQGLVGDHFLNMIQPLAANYPYLVVPGNHDAYDNFSHYKNRFKMPRNYASEDSSYYYSLDIGTVHYVLLNSVLFINGPNQETQTMINWLKQDLELANKNRNAVPWIILLHHHALYCTYTAEDSDSYGDCILQTKLMRSNLEDIYYQNKVDLVVQGHLHRYERETAIYQNLTVPSEYDGDNVHVNANAPVYIVSGIAGNQFEKNDPSTHNPYSWNRKLSEDYGFGKLTAINKTHLLWEQYSSETKGLIDFLYLVKY